MSDILECVEAVKTCSKCGETKPISKFYPHCRKCRDCVHKQQKIQRANPEVKVRIRAQDAARRTQSPRRIAQLLGDARKRAKKKGLPFELDLEWAKPKIDVGFCELTGIPFDMGKPPKGKNTNPYSPSIDRIDPSLGYTKENCRLVITRFNISKHEWNDADHLKLCEAVVKSAGKLIIPKTSVFGVFLSILSYPINPDKASDKATESMGVA